MRYLTEKQRRIELQGEFPPLLDPREAEARAEQEAEDRWIREEEAEEERAHLEELHEDEMEAEYEREERMREEERAYLEDDEDFA